MKSKNDCKIDLVLCVRDINLNDERTHVRVCTQSDRKESIKLIPLACVEEMANAYYVGDFLREIYPLVRTKGHA